MKIIKTNYINPIVESAKSYIIKCLEGETPSDNELFVHSLCIVNQMFILYDTQSDTANEVETANE